MLHHEKGEKKMKKLICVCVLCALCLMVLAGCQCEHEFADANCETPKTCTKCGETEGEALGHTWTDADCTTPKTCSVCKATEGEALGHTWVDADCVTAKTCSVCKATEGEALGHTWVDATCAAPQTCSVCAVTEGETLEHTWVDATTEAPKTCSVCAATEGERIITDERFTTANCAALFGTWECNMEITAAEAGLLDTDDLISYNIVMALNNDGTSVQTNTFKDPDSVITLMLPTMLDMVYVELEGQGFTRDQADAAMVMSYGMTVEEYCKYVLETMVSEPTVYELVYYAQDNTLYFAFGWDEEMTSAQYTLEGDTLTLTYEDGSVEVYTRVVE